jgi:hypothetical protein
MAESPNPEVEEADVTAPEVMRPAIESSDPRVTMNAKTPAPKNSTVVAIRYPRTSEDRTPRLKDDLRPRSKSLPAERDTRSQ